jgi:hypothetical protein
METGIIKINHRGSTYRGFTWLSKSGQMHRSYGPAIRLEFGFIGRDIKIKAWDINGNFIKDNKNG